jgi:hypothetical protein
VTGDGASIAESARYLAEHEEATAFDLEELGLAPNSLLAPELILQEPIDGDRLDLVEEFRVKPLGPHGEELRRLLWNLRAQTPAGRYVLSRMESGGWRALHLIGGRRRPRAEIVPEPEYESFEDAEWAIFRLRWRDHTGQALPVQREPT